MTASQEPPAGAARAWSPLRTGLALGVCTLGVALASGGVLYARAVSTFRLQVRDGLLHAATTAARLVDGDVHETFTSRDQESTPEYAAAVRPLRGLLEGTPGLAYAYTCVLRDGEVRFVLDPTPEGDSDGDGVDDKAHVMQAYPEADPELVEALRTGRPTLMAEPAGDRWGTFMSAYAPIWSGDDRLVGVAGIDMDAAAYVKELQSLRAAGLLGLLCAVVAASVSGTCAGLMRRRVLAGERRALVLLDELASARSDADVATVAKSEFFALMSHELRTPVAGVVGLLSLLEETPLDEDQKRLASLARRSGADLLALVESILEESRLAADRVKLLSAPFDPARLVRDVAERLRPSVGAGVSLQCVVEDGVPPLVTGDAARVRQVATNLADNALKFTPAGHVTLRLSVRDALLVLSVEDTGIGIPSDRLDAIFVPFARVESSLTRRFAGSGLGLSISRRLAQLMGGTLRVTSVLGGGSTFRLEIPLQAAG